MTQTLNLDALYPEPKKITLNGKVIDVSRMPLSVFLALQKTEKDAGHNLTLPEYIPILTTWFQLIDPSITEEWVKKATDDIKILRTLVNVVLLPSITDPLPKWTSDQPTATKEIAKTS